VLLGGRDVAPTEPACSHCQPAVRTMTVTGEIERRCAVTDRPTGPAVLVDKIEPIHHGPGCCGRTGPLSALSCRRSRSQHAFHSPPARCPPYRFDVVLDRPPQITHLAFRLLLWGPLINNSVIYGS